MSLPEGVRHRHVTAAPARLYLRPGLAGPYLGCSGDIKPSGGENAKAGTRSGSASQDVDGILVSAQKALGHRLPVPAGCLIGHKATPSSCDFRYRTGWPQCPGYEIVQQGDRLVEDVTKTKTGTALGFEKDFVTVQLSEAGRGPFGY